MRTHVHRSKRDRRHRQRGVALVFATFAIAALLVALTGALVTGAANSKASWNYKAATQAHFIAESGISDALQNINATGVIHYQNNVVTPWSTRWPVSYFPKTFPTLNGYTYTVTTAAGVANPKDTGRLVANVTGPDGVTNTVVANLIRSDQPSTAPGAIYLATDGITNSTFNGNNFVIDGNDHLLSGGIGPAPAVPGISTRSDSNTQEALSSLNAAQLGNVQGMGYQAGPPEVASVATSASAPTVSQMNSFVQSLQQEAVNQGWPPCPCTQLNNSCGCPDGDAYATPPQCKISQYGDPDNPGTFQVKNTGNIDGCGVMIVYGNLDVQGTVNFAGLVLVMGQITVTGDAQVFGSVWTQGLNLNVGGTAEIYHSSEALTLANTVYTGGGIPTPMHMTSLADCADLGAGVGGCP